MAEFDHPPIGDVDTRRRYPPPPQPEPVWPVQAAVLAAIALHLLLPQRVSAGPKWLLPVLEGVLLMVMVLTTPRQLEGPHRRRRRLAVAVIALITAANITSLALLCHNLLHHNVTNGEGLIIAGVLIWLTNVLIFGIWFWETDRGGPGQRAAGRDGPPGFLFPQMTDDRIEPINWRPQFIDYLYVSLTNSTAFSPTDTMPLTPAAKSMMGVQSLVSLVTVGLVVARSVNII
jgi:uncharacterized membrane protein